MTHPASHRVDVKVAGSPAASQEAVRVLFTDRNGPFFFFFSCVKPAAVEPKGLAEDRFPRKRKRAGKGPVPVAWGL